MNTQLLQCDSEGIAVAGALLKAGNLVALPTETVYGLAANALDEVAVREIFRVKGRPQDNPLIVHISDFSMWAPLVKEIPEKAERLARALWPGPLTIILPKSKRVPDTTTAGMDSVAVRMPFHEGARAIIAAAGVPLAAPSANLSGSPSPTNAQHCVDDLWGEIPLILDGGECPVGIESTVISLVGLPTLLRPGGISPEQLEAALGEAVVIASSVAKPLLPGERPTSPGMKYRHYAPNAKMVLVEAELQGFLSLLEKSPADTWGLVFDGEECLTSHPCLTYGREHHPEEQGRELFAALRTLDGQGATLIYARCPDQQGAALGVYNRMLRAAAFEVIKG